MNTYNREEDGTTYYIKDGVLYGTPTNVDGTYDEENEIKVSDYFEPLTEEEIEEIKSNLN